MNKKYLAIPALFALALAWFIAAPWITVHQIRTAAQSRDAQALAEYVDFESVRASLKEQMNALVLHKMAGDGSQALNPLAALVAPLAGAVVDKMVDAYVTPSGMAQLMAGREPRGAAPSAANPSPEAQDASRKPLAGAEMGYRGMSRFVITTHANHGDTQFVLGRRGLGWKLTEIILPPQ